jgi:hypothetical protein
MCTAKVERNGFSFVTCHSRYINTHPPFWTSHAPGDERVATPSRISVLVSNDNDPQILVDMDTKQETPCINIGQQKASSAKNIPSFCGTQSIIIV